MKNIVLLAGLAVFSASILAQTDNYEPSVLIEDIRCVGAINTDCEYIYQRMNLVPGEILTEDELQALKLKLSGLPEFKTSDVYLEKGKQPGGTALVIDVEEANPYLLSNIIGLVGDRSGSLYKYNGRFAHNNLFGEGKVLDFEVLSVSSLADRNYDQSFEETNRDMLAYNIQYIDPDITGSQKNFLIAGLFYSKFESDLEVRSIYSYLGHDLEKHKGAYVVFGRRIGSISYLSFGLSLVSYQRESDRFNVTGAEDYYTEYCSEYCWNYFRDWISSFNQNKEEAVLDITYGGSTEDDPYFPTSGLQFYVSLKNQGSLYSYTGSSDYELDARYKQTWRVGSNKFFTLKFGPDSESRNSSSFTGLAFIDTNLVDDELGATVGLGFDLKSSAWFKNFRKARWEVEFGQITGSWSDERDEFGNVEYQQTGLGLRLGLRLESKTFGIMDFSISYADGELL